MEPCPYCGGDEAKCNFDWHTDHCNQMELKMSMDEIALALRTKALVENLLAALRYADTAINPPDREGISLDKWNTRLKCATAEIRAAVTQAQYFLDSHGAKG